MEPKLDEDMKNTRANMKDAETEHGEWIYKPKDFDRGYMQTTEKETNNLSIQIKSATKTKSAVKAEAKTQVKLTAEQKTHNKKH